MTDYIINVSLNLATN